MSINGLDSYVKNSLQLLSANPSNTSVSFTYEYRKLHYEGIEATVRFRTSNSRLGLHYKYSTKKSKDFSRVLSAMGPRGINITPGKVEKKKLKKANTDVVGMATLLVNTKVAEYVPETSTSAAEVADAAGASAKGKKKSRNKKRR